jgi:hypothetical protein
MMDWIVNSLMIFVICISCLMIFGAFRMMFLIIFPRSFIEKIKNYHDRH